MNLLSLILMAPQTGQTGGQSALGSIIPLLLVIVIFYFFMIRPQMKKQKEVRQFRDSIKAGDKVLTIGGIYGKVSEVKEQTVLLEIADGIRIKVDKAGLVKDTSDLGAQK